MTDSTINLDLLPPQMRLLASWMGGDQGPQAGIEPLVILLLARGGDRIEIPKATPRVLRGWQEQIGRAALSGLINNAATQRLELPKADKLANQWRNQAIREAKARGESHGQIARRFRLTRRHVINICNGYGERDGDDAQLALDL